MKLKITLYTLIALLSLTSCNSYLDRQDPDTFDDRVDFWVKDANFRMYSQRFYTDFFPGYGSGFGYGPVFSWAPWADDQLSTTQWTANAAASGNGWSFILVRNANTLISRADNSTYLNDEEKKHWAGVGRLFRALAYSNLCELFGAIPWIDRPLGENETVEMFRPRDPLVFAVGKIMEDFEFAVNNIRENDGAQQISRNVAKALMAREMLYFGTFLKYHNVDQNFAKEVLQKAVWAAEEVMKGPYTIENEYRKLFTSEDLKSNKEVILYREYVMAKVTHAILSYNNIEPQTGLSLDAFQSYLAADGLPIKQSAVFNYASDNGRRNFSLLYNGRDPRLYATIVDSLRINKQHSAYSTSGISSWKFLPEVVTQDAIYTGSLNTTDAPVIRLGEILLILAEAKAELGTITQSDLDRTINKLRDRNITYKGVVAPKLPHVTLTGNSLSVNGVIVDDPDRDSDVSPLLWEIRRERRVELMFEGFRKSDLRRWRKFEYLASVPVGGVPPDIILGAWMNEADYPKFNWVEIKKAVNFFYPNPSDKTKGFVYTVNIITSQREWTAGQSFFERQYLNSVPLDQITLYKDFGVELTQNYGW